MLVNTVGTKRWLVRDSGAGCRTTMQVTDVVEVKREINIEQTTAIEYHMLNVELTAFLLVQLLTKYFDSGWNEL